MADLVELTKLKSERYLNQVSDTYDSVLETLIADISQRANTFMDRDTGYTVTTCPADVSDAVCKQIMAEWKHKNFIGMNSTQEEDGSGSLIEFEEGFIPEVLRVLEKYKEYDI